MRSPTALRGTSPWPALLSRRSPSAAEPEANSDHGHSSTPLAMLHVLRRISKQPQLPKIAHAEILRHDDPRSPQLGLPLLQASPQISPPIGHHVNDLPSKTQPPPPLGPAGFTHRLCSRNLQTPSAYRHTGAYQAPFKRRPLAAGGCSRRP